MALLSSMKAVLVELGSTIKLRSAMELGSVVRWRTRLVDIGWAMRWRTGRDGSVAWDNNLGDDDEDWWWRLAMMKIQNRSAKQRVDEGERKKWEGKRKKEEKPEREREREREREYFFNGRGEKFYFILFLIFCSHEQCTVAMELKKIDLAPLLGADFGVWRAKI